MVNHTSKHMKNVQETFSYAFFFKKKVHIFVGTTNIIGADKYYHA